MGRRNRDKSHLGDSWVVNQGSDSDSSYKEDDVEIPTRQAAPPSPVKSTLSKKASSPSSGTPRRRSSHAASKEPEFIMPSIHEDDITGSWMTTNGGRSSAIRGGPRKRSARSGTPSTASEDTQRSQTINAPVDGSSNLADNVLAILQPIAGWSLDVTGGALKALKTPISYAIALYLFLGMLAVMRNLLTSSIYTALSPICRLPGSSLLNLPMCQSKVPAEYQDAAGAPVEFDQLMTVQSQFEQILEQSAGGVSLPLDMKRGETSIRDLRQIVRFSHLHSKNELVLEFDGFIETARMASYDLQKFNSHVGRAVDNVLATARWTSRVLDDISDSQNSRGLIPAFINDRILAPFQPVKFSESALLEQYISHTRIVEDEINRLIDEAQALLQVLSNLEDRLEVIHGISMRDNVHAQGSKDEILSQLWTMLGGNRVALGKHNSQLLLLRRVGEYRKTAWAHVSGTILRLQAMGAELEELRERVGSAELLKDRKEIPLAVHIENIQLGVERLEAGRAHAKQLESEHLRRVLDRGKDEEMRLVEG